MRLLLLAAAAVALGADGPSGSIKTAVGTGKPGYSGDGGLGRRRGGGRARGGRGLFPGGGAAPGARAAAPAPATITTFAGNGLGRHSGDGGPAREASLFGARAVEVGPDGSVYILERQG